MKQFKKREEKCIPSGATESQKWEEGQTGMTKTPSDLQMEMCLTTLLMSSIGGQQKAKPYKLQSQAKAFGFVALVEGTSEKNLLHFVLKSFAKRSMSNFRGKS